MTLAMIFSLPATKAQTTMLLNVFEELRQPRSATVQRWGRRKRELLTIPNGPAQRKRDILFRSHRTSPAEMDDNYLCKTYSGFVQIFSFDAREAVQDWWVKWGRSILMRSPDTINDDDDGPLMPIVLDAEVEHDGPTFPIITDSLMGESDDVIREAEAHRRGQL